MQYMLSTSILKRFIQRLISLLSGVAVYGSHESMKTFYPMFDLISIHSIVFISISYYNRLGTQWLIIIPDYVVT